MKTLTLTNGMEILVDDDVAEALRGKNLRYHNHGKGFSIVVHYSRKRGTLPGIIFPNANPHKLRRLDTNSMDFRRSNFAVDSDGVPVSLARKPEAVPKPSKPIDPSPTWRSMSGKSRLMKTPDSRAGIANLINAKLDVHRFQQNYNIKQQKPQQVPIYSAGV